MLGVAQWRGLGIDPVLLQANIGRTEDTESLSVGRHDSIFDTVVYHFHEMAGAIRTAVQITLSGRSIGLLESRRLRYPTFAGRQRREDRVELFDHVFFAADHHAVTAFE